MIVSKRQSLEITLKAIKQMVVISFEMVNVNQQVPSSNDKSKTMINTCQGSKRKR